MRLRVAILLTSTVLIAASHAQANDRTIDVHLRNGVIDIDDNPALSDIRHRTIRWRLSRDAVRARCTFPPNGVEFDPNPSGQPIGCVKGDPGKAFQDGEADGRSFRWKRTRNYDRGHCFKYTVRLQCTAGDPPPHDPWVKNQ